MKDDSIIVSTKHVPLRVVLFVIACIVALAAFSYAIASLGKKSEGLQVVAESPDAQAPIYGNDYELKIYFRGSSNEIKEEMKRVQDCYSTVLQRAYKLLDAANEYENYPNLATINHNPGKEVEVNEELYAVLKDAVERTEKQEGYSMFAGALYRYWYSILILEHPEDFDPLLHEEEAERIGRLARMTAEPEHFALTFGENGSRTVRLDISAQYQELLENLEIPYEVLDLNLLKDAYLLQLVARVLEENGYTEGYLTTESGLCVTLSGYDKAQYCVYELTDSGVALKKTLPAKPGSAASVFRAFPLREKEAYFCRIEKDGKVYYRNPYVTLGAEGFHNLIQNACVISETDPVDAVYTNIRLHACENTEQVEQIMLENAQYTYDISFFP